MDEWARIVLERLSATPAGRNEWICLLDLAVERQIPEARRLAIQKINETFRFTKEGMTQVALARKYRVKEWLERGMEMLVQGDHFISDADGDILGLKSVMQLARLREGRYRGGYGMVGPATVMESFRDELREMD